MDFGNRKLILAPMSGITDSAFRRICRKQGADIVMSEMVSAEGICRRQNNTHTLLHVEAAEQPVGIQIFGSGPETIASAARFIQQNIRCAFIDLNCGCPMPKIVRKNGGSALLKTPRLFEKIITSLVNAVSMPVTVKIRSGWMEHEWVDVEFARIAERCGVAAITVHPRSRSMRFGGRSRWERIAVVKEAVGIPVIGNGDVTDGADARAMLEQTGCDSVMIGRAALGNPWIFTRARAGLEKKKEPEITPRMRIETIMNHIDASVRLYGRKRASRQMKKHAAWYIKRLPYASVTRNNIFTSKSLEELRELIEQYFINYTNVANSP